jgi:predicted flap endonuclease-1-like 5' DNA nuclease
MTAPASTVRSTMAAHAKVKGNGTNWQAARAYFLALPPHRRSYAEVARRFHVSRGRVSQIARRDGWPAEATLIDQRVREKAATMLARTRAERLVRMQEVADRTSDLALAMLPLDEKGAVDIAKIPGGAPRLDQVLEKIPGLFKMAELAAGEATDRVSIADVRPVLIAFARIAVVHADPDRRGDVVRELEAASSGLVALDGDT